jgi:KDO2-lipid IV(A) lauroyltransferase
VDEVLHRAAHLGGALLAALWWWVVPVRRRVATENLRSALPGVGPAALRRAVAQVAAGYLLILCGRRGRVEGPVPPAGAVAVAGHFSAWDLALLTGAARVPVAIFLRPPSVRLARAWIAAVRRRVGIWALGPAGSLPAAAAARRAGRLVVFVQDQRHNRGRPVELLGRPAWTSTGLAGFLWDEQAPLWGITQGFGPDGRLVVRFTPLALSAASSRKEAVERWTADVQSWLEAEIRARPDAWWWLHDRWRAPAAPRR